MTIASAYGTRLPRWWGLATLLALLAVALAACGGGDDDSAASAADGSRADREQSRDSDNGDGSGAPLPPPAPGELRIALEEPLTLDPALVTDATSASYVVEIFGGLVALLPDLSLAPDLAEAIPDPTPNADGTVTYRFTIRRDALFHNGRRVTADDVKGSIERHASPDTFSPTAADYLGDIVGVRDYIRGRADEILGIQVVDDRTVDITIDAPKDYFLLKLTFPTAFVVDLEQVASEPGSWASHPNGTGPFRVREWNPGEQMVLAPWERFHLGAPHVSSVRVRFAGGGVTQFENDEVDIADVGTLDIDRVRDPADPLNAQYVTGPELAVSYLGFNVKQPPFDDPLVRQAFAMAIDKQTLVEVVLLEGVPVAEGILPPGIPGYAADFRGLLFDPEQAKDLLAQSRYASRLPDIRLTVPGQGATPGDVLAAMQDMWRENLGVEVEIQQEGTATFFSGIDQGLYQMFSLGWVADYPDPENFLDLLFYGSSLQNNTGYNNPEVNALLEAARLELDETRRLDLYRQAERIIVDDAAWLPLFFQQTHKVVKPYVEGYVPPALVVPYLRFIAVTR